MTEKLKTFIIICVLILFSLPIFKPLFDPGFFPLHDDMQIQRVFEMSRALRDGQFPVRMLRDLGYGYHYPLFNFYSPLPYYAGALFNLLGFSDLNSTKIMFFLPNLLSLIFMFLFVNYLTKSRSISFVAGMLYAYFPYRAVDNYVRGVIGEIYVMMFAPLLIWGMINLLRHKKDWLFVASLSGIILSHNIYAFVVCFYLTIFYIFYFLWKRNLREFLRVIFSAVKVIGLTAFFWLPALTEGNYTQLNTLKEAGFYYGKYFFPLSLLWKSEWGYGGADARMSFMLGQQIVVLAAGLFIIILYNAVREKKIRGVFLSLIFFTVLSAFLTNRRSAFIWELIPFLALAQYPLRLIFFIDFFLILFIAWSLKTIRGRISTFVWGIFLIGVAAASIYKNAGYFKSKYNYNYTEAFVSEKYLRWDSSRLADEYVPKSSTVPASEDEVFNGSIKSEKRVVGRVLQNSSQSVVFSVNNNFENNKIIFPVAYFPGWKLYANSREIKITPATKFYLIAAHFAKGDYLVRVEFTDTPARTAGNAVSLLSLSLLATMAIMQYKKYGRR